MLPKPAVEKQPPRPYPSAQSLAPKVLTVVVELGDQRILAVVEAEVADNIVTVIAGLAIEIYEVSDIRARETEPVVFELPVIETVPRRVKVLLPPAAMILSPVLVSESK